MTAVLWGLGVFVYLLVMSVVLTRQRPTWRDVGLAALCALYFGTGFGTAQSL